MEKVIEMDLSAIELRVLTSARTPDALRAALRYWKRQAAQARVRNGV